MMNKSLQEREAGATREPCCSVITTKTSGMTSSHTNTQRRLAPHDLTLPVPGPCRHQNQTRHVVVGGGS